MLNCVNNCESNVKFCNLPINPETLSVVRELRWHSLQTGGSHNLDVPKFVAARFWPVFAHDVVVFSEISVTGCATLRWHSLQTGDSYNLAVPNFDAARFWPVFCAVI